ncbi:helix-hairpin-helix domain-containing protein [Pseudarthrobacter sp. J75]|uniref:helix-hairpin-helix domain-containing protein n=1 Tax=unclassified Pseudarthrobacter TaxID=2647000 RepID=UPI002E8124DF|nr:MULTISPECIES: helix-hairpin-helix domain-containing protein [unclassified Pseudarthrobacter]MEE2523347.1 helix-hairpin-helix domain-containing protein [Pseudarthrobacter sp. J47]MEE2529312.1 helix-hairpin-helix domain-containing protein [Pseudarthrobacter sp. J75]
MSRRRSGGTAGRHAGERLLATLDPRIEEGTGGTPEPGTAADDFFVYTDPSAPQLPSRSPPASAVVRFRTGIRAAVFVAVLCLAGGAWFWWQALGGRTEVIPLAMTEASQGAGVPAGTNEPGVAEPRPEPGTAKPGTAGTGTAEPGAAGSASQPAVAVIHVAGAVNAPGVVTIAVGSRVNDAIIAAGGASAGSDPGRLNLAAVVTDGQKIYVPRPGEELPAEPAGSPPAAGGAAASPGAPGSQGGAKVNLNTATSSELATLPKVGPVLAQKIIDWRVEHGPFSTVEELDAVDGVGPKMLETLLPLVSV